MGERLPCKQDVASSNLVRSTNFLFLSFLFLPRSSNGKTLASKVSYGGSNPSRGANVVLYAGLAQLVERRTRNAEVVGSNRSFGSNFVFFVLLRVRRMALRRVHNPERTGSIPAPATKFVNFRNACIPYGVQSYDPSAVGVPKGIATLALGVRIKGHLPK